ncbi:UPF0158 family protein [Vibrio mediterranei]|jgi:hypothetical protein|uniref:UPF0158 family protein n=1 Tax=Vibrio mediterranei TaxID=689 RepID=UPI001EFE7FBB|nr:UPF0158 family protein [Vibrio mediterranei]MCG9628396.1 UPF0158 family protein [Vibrio mediterranei]
MTLSLSDLESAIEFASDGTSLGSEVFIDRHSGVLHYIGDGVEEPMPDDLRSNDKYIQVPTMQELCLGRTTAIRFARDYIPEDYNLICSYFNNRGAFAKFKAQIEYRGKLEDWYQYQERAFRMAVINWCKEYSLDYAV